MQYQNSATGDWRTKDLGTERNSQLLWDSARSVKWPEVFSEEGRRQGWIFYSYWPGVFPSMKQILVSRLWGRRSLSPSSPTHPHSHTHCTYAHSTHGHTHKHILYIPMPYTIHTTAQIIQNVTHLNIHANMHAEILHIHTVHIIHCVYIYTVYKYTQSYNCILPTMNSFSIMFICTQCTHVYGCPCSHSNTQ